MMPDFSGKKVLDLGCGFGWHCIYAAERGAHSVTGIDISQRMLAEAMQKTAFSNVEYRQMAIEDVYPEPESVDVVISSLALHYVADFDEVCRRVYEGLTPGGTFIFSVEHPTFTAEGGQDWYYDSAGNRLHWPVDRYFAEGWRKAVFLGEEVSKHHRTLTTYINGLLKHGFRLASLVEPQPAKHLLESVPEMADELRRPMMLLAAAVKP